MADRLGSVALGTNVRAIRRSRGLTQTDLALKAGITKSYVCRIEKGKRPVKPELLERLADALDVRVAALDESTVLETRSTAWLIQYAAPVDADTEPWANHSRASGAEAARAALEELREASIDTWRWRAVRVETIETVEVW